MYENMATCELYNLKHALLCEIKVYAKPPFGNDAPTRERLVCVMDEVKRRWEGQHPRVKGEPPYAVDNEVWDVVNH